MRLLCYEMLCGLGRWLRAAGHDTAIAQNGVGDSDLLARAVRERRTLLTRDRHLAAIAPSGVRMVLIETQELDEQARELREALGLDWLFAPFTRCMMDNSVLLAAGPHHMERVPRSSRDQQSDLRACPACGRVYWPGGHVRRMRMRLVAWHDGGMPETPPSPA